MKIEPTLRRSQRISVAYADIHQTFQAAISRFDCGKKCAPLHGGEPVCCSAKNAVPLAHRTEWALLKSRSDLWRRYTPSDASGRKIVEELHRSCVAIECKGASLCERDNRTLACRAFPFFPYITRSGEFAGLAYYWDFEDSCWVISNLAVVDRDFVRQFVAAFEKLFLVDNDELETFTGHSASMRRLFTRRGQIIPLIGRDGGYFKVLPGDSTLCPAMLADFLKFGPYRSESAYAKALKKATAKE